ncbi:hypothetical protein P3W85_18535 [Cupriavidus basilensis]|uniref:Transcriptional regulator LmrA/YxaF-like C-terminal domain-containing protein n=1 Tax=Cupriavidus basilensis TaxID=68895 RepID=A0ABT6ATD5_9BURK|nr:hypothetical protein [Cupriavidus basilensis]MDF3834941.1 hypothetical protein [Cupriavidus basilensis]
MLRELSSFELQTFFTYSHAEHELTGRRRGPTTKLGLALHIGLAAQLGAAWIAHSFRGQTTAAEGIAAVLRDSARRLSEDNYEAGCPVAIVTLERGSHSPDLTNACAAAFASWRRQLAQALEERGFAPERASGIALTALVVLEGCLVVGRATGSTEAFELGLATLLGQLGEEGEARPLSSGQTS